MQPHGQAKKYTFLGQPSTYPKNKWNKKQYRKTLKNEKQMFWNLNGWSTWKLIFLNFSHLSEYHDTLETSGSVFLNNKKFEISHCVKHVPAWDFCCLCWLVFLLQSCAVLFSRCNPASTKFAHSLGGLKLLLSAESEQKGRHCLKLLEDNWLNLAWSFKAWHLSVSAFGRVCEIFFLVI